LPLATRRGETRARRDAGFRAAVKAYQKPYVEPPPGKTRPAGSMYRRAGPLSAAGAAGEDLIHPGDARFEGLARGFVFLLLRAEHDLVPDEFDPRGERRPSRREAEKRGAERADPRRRRRFLEAEAVPAAAGFTILGNDGGIGSKANMGGGDDVAGSPELLAINDSASDTNLLKVLFSPEAADFERGKTRADRPRGDPFAPLPGTRARAPCRPSGMNEKRIGEARAGQGESGSCPAS